jgi:hypothetical protein
VIVQCDECGAQGTGRTNNGRLYDVDLPAGRTARQFTHTCGGALMPYDTKAVES